MPKLHLMATIVRGKFRSAFPRREILVLKICIFRRRNRTTQSCLNCHTSKRMVWMLCDVCGKHEFKSVSFQCDRKRPACARCTQLGLVRYFFCLFSFKC